MSFEEDLKTPRNPYDRDLKALREAIFNIFDRIKDLENHFSRAEKKKKKDA